MSLFDAATPFESIPFETPENIAFVVDPFGSMNDNTETIRADRSDHQGIIICTFGMARSARLMNKFDPSEMLFQRVLISIKATGESPEHLGQTLAEYARFHWARGNLPKADQLFTQAYQHAVAKRGEFHREIAETLASHRSLLKLRKKTEPAKQMDVKAKQIDQSVR